MGIRFYMQEMDCCCFSKLDGDPVYQLGHPLTIQGSPTKTKAVTVCGLNIDAQLLQTSHGRASVDFPFVVQRKEKQCWGDHWSLASKRQN